MGRLLFVSGLLCFLTCWLAPTFAQDQPAEVAPLFRKWKAAVGSFEVEAELLLNERDKVVLKRKDTGKELTLTPDKLSAADRQYLTALAQLEGYWELATVETGGAIMPNKPDNTFHFERGKFKVLSKDGNFSQGTVELDVSKTPKTIDLVGSDHRLRGIYQFDGGALKICGSEGDDRPVNFNTKGPKPFYLSTLKKVDKPAGGVVAPRVPAAPGATAAITPSPPAPAVASNSPANSATPPPKPGGSYTAASYFGVPQSEIDKIIATDRSPKLDIPTEAEKAFLTEVAAAKGPLAALPQFKAKYDALQANPASETDGGELAKLLRDYWNTEKLAEKSPVQSRAVLEEIERLSLGTKEWVGVSWAVTRQNTAPQFPLAGEAARKRIVASLAAPALRIAQREASPNETKLFLQTMQDTMNAAIVADDSFTLVELLKAMKPLHGGPGAAQDFAIHLANMTQIALQIDSPRVAEYMAEQALFMHLGAAGAPQHGQYVQPIRAVLGRARIGGSGAGAAVQLSLDANHPGANYDRGIHLVVNLGRWQEGVKHLALGKDPQYKELAIATQAAADPAAKIAVAARWAELGAAADSPARELARLLLQAVLADPAMGAETGPAAKAALDKLGPSPFTAVMILPPQ